MESQQAKIDTFISYIKNISLHIQYLFHPTHRDFKKIKDNSLKLVSEFDKFVAEYNHRVVQQIKNAKVILTPMFYRTIKDKIENQDFMRFQAKSYGMKFVFVVVGYQCNMHVQLYKKAGGGLKTNSLTLRKLQNCFLHLISKKIDQNVNIKWLEDEAIKFLEQVYQVINGQSLCLKCGKCFSFNNQLKLILAPTVRLETKKQDMTIVRYAHEGCL